MENKLKYEVLHQLLAEDVLAEQSARKDASFFGLINKARIR